MAFPTRTAVTTNDNTSSTSVAVSISSPSSGDLALIVVSVTGDNTISVPSGWTIAAQRKNRVNNFSCAVIYRVCDGSEGATVSITLSIAGRKMARAWIFDAGTYTGVPEAGTQTANATANADPAAVTPSWGAADTAWFAYHAFSAGVTGFPASYTSTGQGQNASAPRTNLAWAERDLNASSEDPGAFTNAANEWITGAIAVQGASAPSGPSPAAIQYYRRLNGLTP